MAIETAFSCISEGRRGGRGEEGGGEGRRRGENRFNWQNNNSHEHRTFLYISLPFLHNYDVIQEGSPTFEKVSG